MDTDTTPISEKTAKKSDIQELYEEYWPKWEPARARIQEVRDSLKKKTQFRLPEDFDVPGKESLIVRFPSKITVPLQIVNLLEKEPPKLTRYAINPSLRAQSVATDVETWINAVCLLLVPWRKLVEKIFLDGACAVGAIPMPAHWRQAPTFLDVVDKKRWSKLSAKRREEYRADDDEDEYAKRDDDGDKLPKSRYFRDARGRSADDSWYSDIPRNGKPRKFKESRKHTRKAWQEERTHWLARRLPFVVRVESPMDCIPFFGEEDELIGLLVKTALKEEDAIYQDLIWDKTAAVFKDESDDGEGITLLEYWHYNKKREPCVTYSVNGLETKRRVEDDEVEAQINLQEEYGLSRLPWTWSWGLRLDSGNIAERAIPYNWAVLDVLTAMEAVATSILIHTYSCAFGGWAIDVNQEIALKNPSIVMDGSKPRTYTFKPLQVMNVPGRPYPLVHPGPGGAVDQLMGMFAAQADAMSPSQAAFGGGGASSGHDRALSREFLEAAMDQVKDGALKAWEFIGECLLEGACGLIEMIDEDDATIPVFENEPIQQINDVGVGSTKTAKYRKPLEFKPDWIGNIYDLEAYYPKSVGENSVMLEQLANHFTQGLVTWREYREKGWGDDSPERTLIEVWIDQYLRTDAGRMEIARLAEEMMRGEFEEEKQKWVDDGQMLPDGTPVDALVEGAVLPGQEPPAMAPESVPAPPDGSVPGEGLISTDMPGDPRKVLAATIGAQSGTGPRQNDAQAIAELGLA